RVDTTEQPYSDTRQMLRGGEDPIDLLRAEVSMLRDILGEMSDKLDRIEAAIFGEIDPDRRRVHRPLSVLNCSGTGLGMIVSQPHLEGDYLRLTIRLRTVPQTVIECMGAVVRCTRLEGEA